MNHQSTLEQFQQLKLFCMAQRYEAILNLPVQKLPELHSIVANLAEAETNYRIHQRTQLYLRLSKLRCNTVPEHINCSADRGITKAELATLADGSFIQRAENLLITPATGVGKSYLTCTVGRQACMLGFRTLYYSMNRLIEALAAARLDGSYLRWINQIAKMPFLS